MVRGGRWFSGYAATITATARDKVSRLLTTLPSPACLPACLPCPACLPVSFSPPLSHLHLSSTARLQFGNRIHSGGLSLVARARAEGESLEGASVDNGDGSYT